MADITRLDVAAVEAAIANYESKKMSMENAYLQISNDVRELGASWTGASSQTFQDRFNDLYKNLKSTEERVDEGIKVLKSVIATYEETEANATAGIEGLDEAGSVSYF